mgnify:FL=1
MNKLTDNEIDLYNSHSELIRSFIVFYLNLGFCYERSERRGLEEYYENIAEIEYHESKVKSD